MHEIQKPLIDPHFAGHESFPLRSNWLPKAVSLIQANPAALMSEEETMVELGVGKNMARSLRHWGESTSILRQIGKEHEITMLGKIIFRDDADPYLERRDTIWLIHYQIVSNGNRDSLWYYLFNKFSSDYIVKYDFIKMVEAWASDSAKKTPSLKTLERDFQCCMNMYSRKQHHGSHERFGSLLASPLKDLRLISGPHENSSFRLRRLTSQDFSPSVFAYSLLDFWEGQDSPETLSIDQIFHDEGSPGVIFRLSEDTLDAYLRAFEKETKKAFVYDKTAGLQQIIRAKDTIPDRLSFLSRLYGLNIRGSA